MNTPVETTAPSLEPHEINEALAEFLSRASEPRQTYLVYGDVILGPGTSRGPKRHPLFTNSLDSMALVRAKMSPEQQAYFAQLLARKLLPVAFHSWLNAQPAEVFSLINADAATQALVAIEVLRSQLPERYQQKLDLAREWQDSIQLSKEPK